MSFFIYCFPSHNLILFNFLSYSSTLDPNLIDKAYVIKSVSDAANEEARKSYESNLELAMTNGVKVLETLLNE